MYTKFTNAKEEFLGFVGLVESKHNTFLECAEVLLCRGHLDNQLTQLGLKQNYMDNDLQLFLNGLNYIEYDAGCGSEKLFGTIWFEDGSWATRAEYDGSEWWEYHSIPAIPEHLKTPLLKR